MAHIKVARRSMSLEQWARVQFERLNELVVAQVVPTAGWQVRVGQYFPDGYLWDDNFHTIQTSEFWGRPDGTAEFRGTVTIPPEMDAQPVWFQFFVGGEVIVHANGQIMDGIDPNRTRILLTPNAKAGESFAMRMEAYTRSMPDDDRAISTREIRGCVQRFNLPNLVVLDQAALALKYDLDILYGLAFGEQTTEPIQLYLHHHIEQLLRLFPLFDSNLSDLHAAIPQIKTYLDTHIYRDDTPFGKIGRLACVAHSHLDIAYHWKVVQTIQKNARTCLIQLRLMDRYPEFTYAHTQAWCYETLEEYYPEIFAEIQQRILEGRWEIVGGMYVEPDCNVPSAEALVRQVIYGKLYFLERFGVEVDNCWLPDVFGNTAVLPQVLKQGGIDYFVSNKMSTWNDTNQFPHNNFIWRGLDGSEVYACVPPTHFITWFEPDQVIESWEAFIDKDVCDESLHMYGYGDGGSGVTEEMLEHFERLNKAPGVPQLNLSTGRDYLHRSFQHADQLAVWDGELYLEMHRGTFTTKADLKRANRRGEFLAQQTESLCTLATLQGVSYPVTELREAWKLLLLNQFHDILPGSHTHAVYHEALETYQKMRDAFSAIEAQALNYLAPKSSPQDVCVFNPFSFIRRWVLEISRQGAKAQSGPLTNFVDKSFALQDEAGQTFPLQQQMMAGGGDRLVAGGVEVAPLSLKKYTIVPGSVSQESELHVSDGVLENHFFRLCFDDRHRLVRIFDKLRQREVLLEGGAANEWQLFEDKPGKYNAWDILPNYEDHPVQLPEWEQCTLVENGPVSLGLYLKRQFGYSRAEQIIRIYADIPRIDFETWIDWQETERLLKVAFPVDVKSRFYTTDTSAGGLEHDNHQNTTWQQARFEVCTHKWTDLSEGMFGVTLLNDCKYGVDVQGNQMRLSLLRAPIRPDRHGDKGEHRFTYSLITHNGDWQRGGVVEAAYDLNWPLTGWLGRQSRDVRQQPPISIDQPALHCQAFKMAEDGFGDVVLRVAELYGSRGHAQIQFDFPFSEAHLCDLLERPLRPAEISDDEIVLPYQPYQIQTLRIKKKQRRHQ